MVSLLYEPYSFKGIISFFQERFRIVSDMTFMFHLTFQTLMKPCLTFAFFISFLSLHHWVAPDFIIQYGSPIVATYMITDFILQPDMTTIFKIHHAMSILLCVREMMMSPLCHVNEHVRRTFIETEWSTLILQLLHIRRNSQLFLLFALLFAYFRIFKIAYIYYRFIDHVDIFRDVPSVILYSMNCYWFYKILDKLYVHHDYIDGILWCLKIFMVWNDFSSTIFSCLVMLNCVALEMELLSCMFIMILSFYGKHPWIHYLPFVLLNVFYYFHKKNYLKLQ